MWKKNDKSRFLKDFPLVEKYLLENIVAFLCHFSFLIDEMEEKLSESMPPKKNANEKKNPNER